MIGQIVVKFYDLHNKTLDYLTTDIKHFKRGRSRGNNTSCVLFFFSLSEGTMLILDASTGNIVEHEDPSFALSKAISSRNPLPSGVKECESIVPLEYVVINSPAVFHKRTFYWFTYGLHSFMDMIWINGDGYDLECLEHKLRPVKALTAYQHPQNPPFARPV